VDLRGLRNYLEWRARSLGAGAERRAAHFLARFDGVPRPTSTDPVPPPAPLAIDLRGRVALVTGASGELGRVIARTLGRCGAHVAVHCHRGLERGETLRGEIARDGGRSCLVQADLTDADGAVRLRDEVTAQLGAVEIVVVSAVAQYDWRSVLAQPLADFDQQYRTSVLQTVLLAKTFAPGMIARSRGRIIGISTECALQAECNQGAYVAGKRGMDGVMRVLARELGPDGITVNQVAPGWMISDKHRASGTERQPRYEAHVPLRRRGTDEDVAHAVAFLASDLYRAAERLQSRFWTARRALRTLARRPLLGGA
jgi:3-oxoacyl-[acyl-carrier protein] reductase